MLGKEETFHKGLRAFPASPFFPGRPSEELESGKMKSPGEKHCLLFSFIFLFSCRAREERIGG